MGLMPDGFPEPKEKPLTRPLQTVLLERIDILWGCLPETAKFIASILPWVNTDSRVNKAQEAAFSNFNWEYFRTREELRISLISFLNSLRG